MGLALAHHAPAPVLRNDLFDFVAERQELLAQPACNLTPVNARVGLFVFARLNVEERRREPIALG
jgi:hypothetical protein